MCVLASRMDRCDIRQAFAETTALHPKIPKLRLQQTGLALRTHPLGAANRNRGAGTGSKLLRVAFPAAMAPMLVCGSSPMLWRRARWWQLQWCFGPTLELALAAQNKKSIRNQATLVLYFGRPKEKHMQLTLTSWLGLPSAKGQTRCHSHGSRCPT
jgi:hypothetical protein